MRGGGYARECVVFGNRGFAREDLIWILVGVGKMSEGMGWKCM